MTAQQPRADVARARRRTRATTVIAGLAIVAAAALVALAPAPSTLPGLQLTWTPVVDGSISGGAVASGVYIGSAGDAGGEDAASGAAAEDPGRCSSAQSDAVRAAVGALPWKVTSSQDGGDVIDGVCQGSTLGVEASSATWVAVASRALQDAGFSGLDTGTTDSGITTLYSTSPDGQPVELSVRSSSSVDNSLTVHLTSGFSGGPGDLGGVELYLPVPPDETPDVSEYGCSRAREVAFQTVRAQIRWKVLSEEDGGDESDGGCFGPQLVVDATYDTVVAGLPKLLARAGVADPAVVRLEDGTEVTGTLAGVEVQVWVGRASSSTTDLGIASGLF